MAKQYDNKYWENESGETVKFGRSFMRCFDKAGKLQFGTWYKNKAGEEVFQVKFVIDRNELCSDFQAASYLRGTISDWEEMIGQGDGDVDDDDD